MAGGLLLTGLNVWGAKESGHFTPFFPFGGGPIFATTALVFVSFLGFVKIAAVAEEIRDPARNLPRALIGSVVVVTVLYVVIVRAIAGIFPQREIGAVRDPFTAAARLVFGPVGAGGIIFAGLLATASSANASIMASSRINLAMARDRLVPDWLAAVHDTLLTPHRAIGVTGLLAVAFLAIQSLESLAKIASALQLLIYAGLNLACVALRGARPEWYRPSYRSPGYPYAQIAAAAGCLVIIAYSGGAAKVAVGVLVTASLLWYAAWGRSRMEMEHGVPGLRRQWARLGIRAFFLPPRLAPEEARRSELPPKRTIEPNEPRRLLVALAAPEHEADLLQMGRYNATGRERGGEVVGLHLDEIPLHTPLEAVRDRPHEPTFIEATLRAQGELAEEVGPDAREPGRPLGATSLEVVSDWTHDVFDARSPGAACR